MPRRDARDLLDGSSIGNGEAHAVSAVALPARRARRKLSLRWLAVAGALVALGAAMPFLLSGTERTAAPQWRTLSGRGNNVEHPTWGEEGLPYARVTLPFYADGIAKMAPGPPARYISNRIFNDVGQNLFSENDVSQWGWVWGQFLDHTFGLRNEKPGEQAPIPFDKKDPLERFRNDLGAIDFSRTPAAPGTGVSTPRQQINTVPSFIDAYAVYGGSEARLEWLRRGPVDGNMANNSPYLLLPGGYLPRESTRGKVSAAPQMDLMGPLVGERARAAVAGDVRANENVALTATHTLFAREHNRIVSLLPASLSAEDRFQIARRVVGAEEQYITYNEFLPAMGIRLPPYTGYKPNVDPAITNEFATVGYRVHSMVHGELEPSAPVGYYSRRQLRTFGREGITVEREGARDHLVIPLDLTFGNPDLLQAVGLGPVLSGLGDERQYKNDEQIDESLRSILFQIPKPGNRDPRSCGEPVIKPGCFSDVQDLGAIDVERGRDHGMPPYNEMRVAYGLAPKRSYAAITGESTESFPRSPLIDRRDPIDDPNILDFTQLKDADGKVIKPKSDEAQEDAVVGIRRTTLAARLKAIYGAGNVNKVDAFVGMLSEPHVPGTEFGQLQLAMWTKQFEALRDGDRFFYLNDPMLGRIRQQYGIDYRHTLAEIIRLDTHARVQADVFKAPAD
ncbi:MAG TPA: peroxidase family protein [Gaiellaceae bacterium]|nr:peroxidase family protein [Gaiellaceae bacterium]